MTPAGNISCYFTKLVYKLMYLTELGSDNMCNIARDQRRVAIHREEGRVYDCFALWEVVYSDTVSSWEV